MQVESWLLLRCREASTMKLWDELPRAGVEVWVPIERFVVRVPRVRKSRAVERPIMPGFLFLPELHAEPAIDYLVRSPNAFRFFKFNGQGSVKDAELEGLRAMERGEQRAPKPERFVIGERIQVVSGPFCDKTGLIEGWDGLHYAVAVDGFALKFLAAPCLLRRFQV